MTIDELLDQQPPDVRAEIEAITDEAGTWDADWQILLTAGRRMAELREYWRQEREKSVAPEALNLLFVMRPIDWSFVFSAPMNGKYNADRIIKAMESLEQAFARAESQSKE